MTQIKVDISDIPDGWVSSCISKVCLINPPKPKADYLDENTHVSFVPMPAVDANTGSISSSLIRSFGEVRKGFTAFRDGDVIVAKITPCMENGKAAVCRGLLNGYGFGSTEFHVLRSSGSIIPEYVYHFLRQESFRRKAAENMTGSVGQKRVPSDYIASAEIPLPPLAEQKRIVAKVGELLSRVNEARERLAKAPAILKRFRQSILATACSGQLTAEWREKNSTVETALVLLKRLEEERHKKWTARNSGRRYKPPEIILQEELPEIPETWVWTNFDHCTWEITVGHVGPMKDRYIEKGVSFLRSQNVRPLRFESVGLVFINNDFHSTLRKSKLEGGEILITRSGANTGDCCVYPKTAGEANCSDLVITRPLSGLVSEFGAIYVTSPEGQSRIGLRETGMAQPHFNIGAMRVKAFPLPPLPEQHEIVRRVEALFALADRIEARLEAAVSRVEKITQAILAKAFRGELVPTEAELARREGRDYEPAGVLLERIRKSREGESSQTERRPRKRKKSG